MDPPSLRGRLARKPEFLAARSLANELRQQQTSLADHKKPAQPFFALLSIGGHGQECLRCCCAALSAQQGAANLPVIVVIVGGARSAARSREQPCYMRTATCWLADWRKDIIIGASIVRCVIDDDDA